jgi:hypothetical protein
LKEVVVQQLVKLNVLLALDLHQFLHVHHVKDVQNQSFSVKKYQIIRI